MKPSLIFLFLSSDHFTYLTSLPYNDEQANSFSPKSLKPNVFIKTFEWLLWTFCQVFQMEIPHLTK